MKAMLIRDNNALEWAEVPNPVRKEQEVLIEVHATAVNRADLLQRAGQYPPAPGWPEWPGLEVSGTIRSAPANSTWKAGDKVCALLGGGGYAENVVVPAAMCLPVPEGLSMEEAAGIPEVYATAYLNFCLEAGIQAGDTVFIQAGASGLGIASIQLAKFVGAKVITTVGSDEKAEFVRRLGADIVINRKKESIEEVLTANPVDIALDCVSGPGFGKCLNTMAFGGRWIIVAALGGNRSEIILDTIYKKRLRIIGSTLRSRTSEMKAEILQSLRKMFWSKFSSGKIKSEIYRVLPMSQVEEAHRILATNENTGKVILTLK